MTSAVLIIPTANRDEANAWGEAQGYGPGSFSVPLTPDSTTISHYGCRAEVTQAFIDLFSNPPPDAEPILAVMIYDFREADGYTHFQEVIAANGLTIWQEPEDI